MGVAIKGNKIKGGIIKSNNIAGLTYNNKVIYKKAPDVMIYGIQRNVTSSDPAWTRTDSAIDLVANAYKTTDSPSANIRNDFDNIYPWSGIYTYSWKNNREYKYDESGFNYTDDCVMVKIPEFWWKRWRDGNVEHIQIADKEIDGFNKSNEFSVGRYPMSAPNYSKSGVYPNDNSSFTTLRSNAKNKGSNWGLIDYRYFILQLLYLVEYANYDSQKMIGKGACAGMIEKTGFCDKLGIKSGEVDEGEGHIVYRGIEDIYGQVHEYIDGIYSNGTSMYVSENPDEYDNRSKYKKLNYSLALNSTYHEGQILQLGYDANNSLYGFPVSIDSASYYDPLSTYIPDVSDMSSGTNYIAMGWYTNWEAANEGFFDYSDHAGFFAIKTSNGNSSYSFGSRLIKW